MIGKLHPTKHDIAINSPQYTIRKVSSKDVADHAFARNLQIALCALDPSWCSLGGDTSGPSRCVNRYSQPRTVRGKRETTPPWTPPRRQTSVSSSVHGCSCKETRFFRLPHVRNVWAIVIRHPVVEGKDKIMERAPALNDEPST